MDSKITGILLIIISGLIAFIIYSFNSALSEIITLSCEHGSSCPMFGTLEYQTNVSMAITLIVFFIGLYFLISPSISTKLPGRASFDISERERQDILRNLSKDERKVMEILLDEKGSSFQSDIVEKSGFPKAKVTRVLDRLEGRGIVERKRRGMTNMVIVRR